MGDKLYSLGCGFTTWSWGRRRYLLYLYFKLQFSVALGAFWDLTKREVMSTFSWGLNVQPITFSSEVMKCNLNFFWSFVCFVLCPNKGWLSGLFVLFFLNSAVVKVRPVRLVVGPDSELSSLELDLCPPVLGKAQSFSANHFS